MTESVPLRPRRLALAALAGLATHAVVALAGFVAGRLVRPSASAGEFADLAALLYVLFLGEIVVGIACLVTGIVLLVRGRRDVGLGLLGGWLVGLLVGCFLLYPGGPLSS